MCYLGFVSGFVCGFCVYYVFAVCPWAFRLFMCVYVCCVFSVVFCVCCCWSGWCSCVGLAIVIVIVSCLVMVGVMCVVLWFVVIIVVLGCGCCCY